MVEHLSISEIDELLFLMKENYKRIENFTFKDKGEKRELTEILWKVAGFYRYFENNLETLMKYIYLDDFETIDIPEDFKTYIVNFISRFENNKEYSQWVICNNLIFIINCILIANIRDRIQKLKNTMKGITSFDIVSDIREHNELLMLLTRVENFNFEIFKYYKVIVNFDKLVERNLITNESIEFDKLKQVAIEKYSNLEEATQFLISHQLYIDAIESHVDFTQIDENQIVCLKLDLDRMTMNMLVICVESDFT